MDNFEINGRLVGRGQPAYIIAELSANHNNSFDVATKTVRAIKAAGADAVKLQTYTADTITLDCDTDLFRTRKESLGGGRLYHELYREASMPWEWQPKLQALAGELGLDFFSSPFDESAVQFLEGLGVPAYKVASLEITDIPLIRSMARRQKPMLISTGVATDTDILLAVGACREEGNDQIALLRCTSAYPTPPDEMNLRSLASLESQFGRVVIGLSDHTMTLTAVTAAIALGASIVEKHFILDRSMGGVDSSFSLDQREFKEMVSVVRETEAMLGSEELLLTPSMEKARRSTRSLFVVEDMKEGELFDSNNLRSIRPGAGMHPRFFGEVIGRAATLSLTRGTPLLSEHVKGWPRSG